MKSKGISLEGYGKSKGKDFQKHNLKQCSQITNDQENAALLKKGSGIYSIKTPPSYQ